MGRFDRPAFNIDDLSGKSSEAQNRLIFDWWCDEDDRLAYIGALRRQPTAIPSRAVLDRDPAPHTNEPAEQGVRQLVLISDPDQVRLALTDHEHFGNEPYAALGGGGFLLAQDPAPPTPGPDWHGEQQAFIAQALRYSVPGLHKLAALAVEQAALTCLTQAEFDLAGFAEQATLRYFSQLFGYGYQDHALLEEACRATYRGLQYIAIGQHFVSEPGTLPAAKQALGRLVARTSALMDDYTRLERAPRKYGFEPARRWPVGVQPWSEIGLSLDLCQPLLKRAPGIAGPLSGRDRAVVAATLLAGTLGNVQSAVCLLVQCLLQGPADEREALRDAEVPAQIEADLMQRLSKLPPVPVLPRRVKRAVDLPASAGAAGMHLDTLTDCLLLLEGQPGCRHAHTAQACARVWGDVARPAVGTHACLGREVSMPLIAALVHHTLNLRGLKPALDPLNGEVLKVDRLWGFACTRYPLAYERERVRVQQNLIVSMRVKPPVSENAARLRRIIAAAVPRIEHALRGFGSVHFAWFEFSEGDTHLVLRTIYDGQFEAYIEHFALRAGDLFDGLFEFLEDAPPGPVAEHPHDFVETIRRFNRAPVGRYLYSAEPSRELRPKPGRPPAPARDAGAPGGPPTCPHAGGQGGAP